MSKKKKWFVICFVFICIILFYKSQVVSFYDKEFERAVRELMTLNRVSILKEREQPIKGPILRRNVKDVDGIFIDLNEYRITDMRDIKKFTRLEKLDLCYLPKDDQTEVIQNGDMPKNMDSICSLRKLKRIWFVRINIDSSFKREQVTVKDLFIRNCVVEDDDFIKKFPEISLLVIDRTKISSFEFLKEVSKLRSLCLYNNTYNCSLEQLNLATDLEELQLKSDETAPFEQVPLLITVKELRFRGKGAPRKAEAGKYIEWGGLEKLYLENEQYDVKTDTWSNY